MKNINAKQYSNAFQEKYLHKDIIIENDERHVYIDLEKKKKYIFKDLQIFIFEKKK